MPLFLLIIVGFLYEPDIKVLASVDPFPSAESCNAAMLDTMHKISLEPKFAQSSVAAHCERIVVPERL